MRKTRASLKSLINRRGKKKKGGGKESTLKTINICYEYSKRKNLRLSLLFSPLGISQGATPIFTSVFSSLQSISTWRKAPGTTSNSCVSKFKKKKKGIYPSTPGFSLFLIVRLIPETLKCLIPFGVGNTRCCKPGELSHLSNVPLWRGTSNGKLR